MANKKPITTLLIGLGGSGAWTVINVKRQLYDAYNNRVPDNVGLMVFDTAKTDITSVGAEGLIREEGQGIGQTVLSRYEKAHVGGDAYELVREIDETDAYSHISSWFLSSPFLKELPRATFALDQGAGQFRQFGRLALFRDVMSPANSAIAATINNRLVDLDKQRRRDDPAMSVILTGSLAGGTGAGMFIDVAHLVRRVADINGIDLSVRGFLYLPDSFKGDLNKTELEMAEARSFAALRELSRFLLNEDYKYGYPMHYHSSRVGTNNQLWRSSQQGKLYDYVYVIDGKGLNNRSLPLGPASAVADGIVNFMDENFGPVKNQYEVNTRGKIANLQAQIGKVPFISTMGAYSIIMPIQQITEKWAHNLALDMLTRLLPGETDERGYMKRLASDASPERETVTPQAEVRRLAESVTPLTDPRDPNRQRQLMPLPLWRKVHEIYTSHETEQGIVTDVSQYDLVDWLQILVPPEQENDPELAAIRNRTIRILMEQFNNLVETSDERSGGDPTKDWAYMENTADEYIRQQLGKSVRGGGRQGGEYADSLEDFISLQANRYRGYMTSYILDDINGVNSSDVLRGKTGKLGWLMAVFGEMRGMFLRMRQVLHKVRTGEGVINPDMSRREVEEDLRLAQKNMEENQDSFGLPGLRGRSDAVKTQKAYIRAVQEYVDHYRMEFARDAIARTVEQIIDFTDELLEQFQQWRDVLATANDSLHNRIVDRIRLIETDRAEVSQLANHRVINDKEWESEHYERYVGPEVMEDLMRRWNWDVTLERDGNRERFVMGTSLRVDSGDRDNPQREALRPDEGRGRWADKNQEVVLSYVRRFFQDAIKQESLVEYIMGEKTEGDLANELWDNSSLMLDYSQTQAATSAISGYILLARHDGDDQLAYLREVNTRLAARNNRGATENIDDATQILQPCSDAFRITLLTTLELMPMEAMTAYDQSMQKYLSLPWDTRQKNHIFPAEVHSVDYERQLADTAIFEQPDPRMLSTRVSLLLENEKRFNEFLFLLTYGLIRRAERDMNNIVEQFWVLKAPSPVQGDDNLSEWMLTAPARENPSLLEAMISYVIRGHDVTNESRLIPYGEALEYLTLVQEHDTAKRIRENRLAESSTSLQRYLQAFSPPLNSDGTENLSNWTEKDDSDFLGVAQLIARYDRVASLANDFKQYITRLKGEADEAGKVANNAQTHDEALRKQELYDLFSIAVIGLNRELRKYMRLIKDRHDVKTGGERDRRLID